VSRQNFQQHGVSSGLSATAEYLVSTAYTPT